jgi:hypothetical protein
MIKNTTIVTNLSDAAKVYDFHKKAGDSILGLRLVKGINGEDCFAIDWMFIEKDEEEPRKIFVS